MEDGSTKCTHDGCQRVFKTKLSLERHIESLHDTGLFHYSKFDCDKCESSFRSPNFWLSHSQSAHNEIPPLLQKWARYQCDVCKAYFLAKGVLIAHKAFYHSKNKNKGPKKMYSCPYCQKEFSVKTNLIEHINVHENNTPFDCEFCNRKFGSESKRKCHINTVHTRVTCNVCGQIQYNSFYLKRHKASAHGILPPNAVKCPHCPEWFSYQSFLDRHMRNKHQ